MPVKQYRCAKGLAIFIYLIAPLMIVVFLVIALMPILPFFKEETTSGYFFFLPLSLGMIALMVAGIIDVYKWRLIIDDEKVYTVGLLPRRELLFQEIKGYRID